MTNVMLAAMLGGWEVLLILCVLAIIPLTVAGAVFIAWRVRREKKPPVLSQKTERLPKQCPQCGAALRSDIPEGLCPACLLQHGIATKGGAPGDQPPFVPPTLAELSKLFPQLEIISAIGKGGMGAVYKARQPALDRFVALKILAPRPGNELDFGSRFSREARALARLSHPNIVAVYDFGVVSGLRPENSARQESPEAKQSGQSGQSRHRPDATPASLSYFIMEFVDGPNLRQVQQAGRLAPSEALEIIPQICAALQFAHDEGIVHRDIKPENVLLDKKGRVKIADFGLAKIVGQEAQDFRLTGAKDVMGTPHYMAPEQVEKPQEVDHRADIFSLGVVFYEMLTGELPLGRFAPPSHKVQMDVRLDEIVLRALEKEPNLRYQQASELKTHIENVSLGGATPKIEKPNPVLPARQSRFQSIACAIANILVALVLATIGGAAYDAGSFFNVLFIFIILSVPVYVVLILWALYRGNLEYRLWRKPFAPELRRYWLPILNSWVFWLLAAWVLELCIVPAQFSASEYSGMRVFYWAAIIILILLELLPSKRIYWGTNLLCLGGSIFIGSQITRIYWPSDRDAVLLSSPVNGEWVVLHGGRSGLINNHFFYQNQLNGLDLIRVVNGRDRHGDRGVLKSYAAWGAPVFAPAEGRIVTVVNDLADNQIRHTDKANLAGNHIVIEMETNRYVMLAHLQKGSIVVKTGDKVHVGQPLARTGNSGNTSQPHLHIQAQNQPDVFADGIKTFPIQFQDVALKRSGKLLSENNVVLRRNDMITAEIQETNSPVETLAPDFPSAREPVAKPISPAVKAVSIYYDDVAVELYAISSGLGTNRISWHPNGVLLTNFQESVAAISGYPSSYYSAPSNRLPIRAFPSRSGTDQETEKFQFLFRVKGPASPTFYWNGQQLSAMPLSVLHRPDTSVWPETFWRCEIELPAAQNAVDLGIGLNAGPWLVNESIPVVQNGEPTSVRITCGGLKWNIHVKLQETNGWLRMTGSHPLYWSEGWEQQLVLVSGGGGTYNCFTNESVLNHGAITRNEVNEVFKNLVIEDIADVRFRIRPTQKFKLQNISLREGYFTMVTVTNMTLWKKRPDDFKVERLNLSTASRPLPDTANDLLNHSEVASGSPTSLLASDLETRFAAAREILAFTEKDSALAAVARDASAAGEVAIVRKALGQMTAFTKRDEVTRDAACRLAGNGHPAEALELARTITAFTVRDATLRELADK